MVVPKRWAKRSVTRHLIKREVREAFAARAAVLPGGLWVVRLKAGFDRTQFRSPASPALQQAVRAELELALRRGQRGRVAPPAASDTGAAPATTT
jgi:ribonuclease P protein component